MPFPDRVNDVYPNRQITFDVTNDGLNVTDMFTIEFGGGFFILYTSPDYTDGTHTLVVKNDFGQDIPAERINLPAIIQKASPSFDPLVIATPGGLVDSASGVARLFSVLDLETNNFLIELTSTGVTVGALIMIQIFGFPSHTPTEQNQII
jgi:hypothetical protein